MRIHFTRFQPEEKQLMEDQRSYLGPPESLWPDLKGNSGIFKPRPYFWHEIRLSTHREQFGESGRPLRAI